jgi:hypothetical protein
MNQNVLMQFISIFGLQRYTRKLRFKKHGSVFFILQSLESFSSEKEAQFNSFSDRHISYLWETKPVQLQTLDDYIVGAVAPLRKQGTRYQQSG